MKIKNSIYYIIILIMISSCSTGSDKKNQVDRLLEEKCQFIENVIEKSISTTQCLCIEEEIGDNMKSEFNLDELQDFEKSPSKLEIQLKKYLMEEEFNDCLQTP